MVGLVAKLLIRRENLSYRIDYSGVLKVARNGRMCLKPLVGAGRFELPTPCAQGRCATKLRHAPTGTLFPL